LSSPPAEELDEIDKKLLKILQQDAKTPYAKISDEIGISEATVHLRIKRLLKSGVILGFQAIVNPKKVGINYMALTGLNIKPSESTKILERLSKVENVYEVYVTAGRYNIVAKVRAKDSSELLDTLKVIERIPGITSMDVMLVLSTIKEETRIRIP